MVLPRTPIVLCELAEDMEYEVKRKFEGILRTQPRENNFIIQRYLTRNH